MKTIIRRGGKFGTVTVVTVGEYVSAVYSSVTLGEVYEFANSAADHFLRHAASNVKRLGKPEQSFAEAFANDYGNERRWEQAFYALARMKNDKILLSLEDM